MKNLSIYYILGAIVISTLALHASANESGNKQAFIDYCSSTQSPDFCQCAVDEKFDFVYQSEVNRRKKVMDESQKNLATALQWAQNSDPTLNEAKIKQYCPIKKTYQSDVEAYAMDKFGSKRILRRTMEVKADIEAIRLKHAAKMDSLHGKFGTNEITRQNFNQMKIPYCTSLIQYQIDNELYERAGDPTFENRVQVPFRTVIGSVIKDRRSSCRALFKR